MLITLSAILLIYLISLLRTFHLSDKDNEFNVKDISLAQLKQPDKPLLPPPPPASPKLLPPPKVETIKFTPPEIVKDEEVPKDEKPPEIDKIDDAKIATVNQKGERIWELLQRLILR